MPPRGGSKSQSAGSGTTASTPASGSLASEAKGAPAATPQQPAPDARFPLFYRSLTPLDAARHGGKSLKQRIGYDFARSSHAVLLNGSEFEAAARFYPIVFTPAPASAALAVVGVRRDRNLFVDAAGDWRPGTYIPAYIRRYPFIFHESADKQQYTLCLDETSGALEDGKDRPLFSGSKPTPIVQDALKFCAAFQRDYTSTHEFVEQLSERGILIPNQAEITLNSGEKLAVTGFHIIDRDRFAGLPDSAFLEWRRKGWLPWVYAHFVSHGNWPALVDLAGAAAKAA
jgi:SapC protein